MNQEKSALQEVWRTARKSEQPTVFNCGTESNAKRFRFALYNAIKGVRRGTEIADPELKDAIDNVSISFDKEDRSKILLAPKIMSSMMQQVMQVIGKKADELIDSEAAGANDAINRILQKNKEVAFDPNLPKGRPDTPYYKNS